MNKKEEQSIEELKKTAEAHGTLSEETAESQAKDSEGVTEKMIKETEKKEEAKPAETPRNSRDRSRKFDKAQEDRELLAVWEPKTKLGLEVKNKSVKSIEDLLNSRRKILEEQIVDSLIEVETDLISIGQAKGKFGGGKRRAWRQTQRKTKEGNVPTFSTMAVVGDNKGHVGLGVGRAKETLPARDKATRQAKLSLIQVKRACSDFDCACDLPHTVPFKVMGKAGSCRVILLPAPQGTGLVAANEIKKILKLAGISDVYSKTFGKQRTTFNLAKACFDALKKTNRK